MRHRRAHPHLGIRTADPRFRGLAQRADFAVNWTFTGPGGTNYVEPNVICYNGESGENSPFLQAGGGGENMPGIPPVASPKYDGERDGLR